MGPSGTQRAHRVQQEDVTGRGPTGPIAPGQGHPWQLGCIFLFTGYFFFCQKSKGMTEEQELLRNSLFLRRNSSHKERTMSWSRKESKEEKKGKESKVE